MHHVGKSRFSEIVKDEGITAWVNCALIKDEEIISGMEMVLPHSLRRRKYMFHVDR